ncbi:probable endo-1,3(4)-beta-glucanase ARB_01444 [Lolium rigidum]|uniref:probable endo-1,3(4)-beta-glucanase ARB_01444 n=1 Tax=Lolium rigidum TaxID=89674 RepID=UPI001F5E05AA|nr:probable endo-1,3(4)-beta-glucanase ARB_01444 [Lolium rigidum]
MFPPAASTVLPDPARFFAPGLLSAPLPTNSFFQNFVLKNGDMPEYIHPYLIKSAAGGLTVCYPRRSHSASTIVQTFVADLTVSSPSETATAAGAQHHHRVAAFDDLSVTLDVSPSLRAFLVRGCPYVTVSTTAGISVATSAHAFVDAAPCDRTLTKWRLRMTSGQTFLLYADAPIQLSQSGDSQLSSACGFSGVVRVAYLPAAAMEADLDRYSQCFPTAGEAVLNRPFSIEYTWRTQGSGDLLMLAHPLHLQALYDDLSVRVLKDFRYRSIDGDLVGVVGSSWILNPGPISRYLSPTWHAKPGYTDDGVDEIVAALRKDVDCLASCPIMTSSCYLYGKAIARAARLALIAEEVRCPDVIPEVRRFLIAAVTPWLDGSFEGNGFLYEPKWGGLVTRQGLTDPGADSGFGIYNDHHYQLGYFLYAIAVLVRIDPAWGRKYKSEAYSILADFMTLARGSDAMCTRLRNFDLWKLHSWASGLTESGDGRSQERTGEAVNAYYGAKLLGLSYKDNSLITAGTTLTAFEILAARTWWHAPMEDGAMLYPDEFRRGNRVVNVVWANKRGEHPGSCPPERRLGVQVLPLLPITQALFSDVAFVRELVEWSTPALSRQGAGEGWKGFVYALEGIYDKDSALEKAMALSTAHDDGNTLTNLLWWLHSRSPPSNHASEWLTICLFRPQMVDALAKSLEGRAHGARGHAARR